MMPFAGGHRLGPFEIRSEAGGSFAGEVYRARNTETGHDVYLRVLTHAYAGIDEDLAGANEHLRAAFGLVHPHILAVTDVGCSGEVLFAVCDFQDGETLRQRLHRTRLPRERAADFGIQIARALIGLHRAGLLHGDLTPEHILITKEGVVRVMDGGLANLHFKERLAPDSVTAAILIADYASPEQIRGERETWSSDMFSWGVILYEMLSGTRPFLRPTLPATTRAVLADDIPELDLRAPALDRIIRQATRKKPSDRFDSARDLAFAMESFGSFAPPGNRVRKTVRERQTVPFLVSVAMLTLGLGAGALIARRYLRPTVVTQLSFRPLTFSGHDSSPAAAPDGKAVMFVSDRDGSERIWTARLDQQDEKALTSGPDHGPRVSPDGRTLLFIRTEGPHENLYTLLLQGGKPLKLLADVQGADWSPSGSEIVWVRVSPGPREPLSILGTAGAQGAAPRELTRVPGKTLQNPRWSPDGKYIASSVGNSILVAPLINPGQYHVLSPPPTPGSLSSIAWLTGDQLIYLQSLTLAGANGWPGGVANIIRQDVETGATAVLGFSQQSALHLEKLKDGSLVFDSNSGRKNLEEVSLDSGRTRFLTVGDSDDQDPAYSPDGQSIYFSSFRGGNLEVWREERASGAFHRVVESHSSDSAPCLSFDGTRIFWSSSREGHFEVYSSSLDGNFTKRLSHNGSDAEHPSVSPLGDWVVYSSSQSPRNGIWKIRLTGLDESILVKGDNRWPEISPDGRYVLYVAELPGTRAIRVATLDTGSVLPFEVKLPYSSGKSNAALGKAKWMPGSRAIAYIGEGEDGASGVYSQAFSIGSSSSAGRSKLSSFDSRRAVQSFAISPDGKRLAIASWELGSGLVQALNVPGLN